MRFLRPLTIAGLLLISACYQQPVISPQRPLRCTPAQTKSECPKGFTCVPTGVCAPNSCQKNEDCPVGLTCSSRGCVPVADGGVDGASLPLVPDGGAEPADGSSPDTGPVDVAPSPDLFTPMGGNG